MTGLFVVGPDDTLEPTAAQLLGPFDSYEEAEQAKAQYERDGAGATIFAVDLFVVG